MDDAYDKVTKDNKRKDHEFDRKVERALLKDIENGYDTLGKLHGAYKKRGGKGGCWTIRGYRC